MSRCRATTGAAAVALVLVASTLSAAVSDYLGKPIATVTIRSEGRIVSESTLADLVETRAGQPLTLAAVRASITHLFSLGRFEDVRVQAEALGDAVALVYELVPLPIVSGFEITGLDDVAGVSARGLRRVISERFGAVLQLSRGPEIARAIEEAVREAGYLLASVGSRTVVVGERSTLVFDVAAGARSRMGTVDVQGDPGMSVAEFLDRLDVSVGGPFRANAIAVRMSEYVGERRRRGFLSARVAMSPTPADAGTIGLTLSVYQGPRVRVEFKGDTRPSDRWPDLVPIEREGSVDEDVLEDSRNRIEDFLRLQGYREAVAAYSREEVGGELVIAFTVTRGRQYWVSTVTLDGNRFMSRAALEPHLRVRPGQPFSAAALDADVVQLEDAYRREGFSAVDVVSSVDALPATSEAGAVPVAIRIVVTEHVRTLVNSVRIVGGQALGADAVGTLGLAPGRPFFAAQLAIDRDALQLRYANSGYPSATVDARPGLSADGAGADVEFAVNEGDRIFVDHVLVMGNERTTQAAIRRELQFKPGDPLSIEALNDSQRRLAGLGLFRRVRITEVRHGQGSRRDILVAVDESPLTTVGYGGGFEVGRRLAPNPDTPEVAAERREFAPRASFEIGRRNLFGTNRSAHLFTSASLHPENAASSATAPQNALAGYGFLEYRLVGQVQEPRALSSTADLRLTAALEQQRRSSFDFSRRSVSVELARRLASGISVSGGYQIQRTRVFNVSSEERLIDRIFPNVRLSSFALSVIRDTRDDPFGPLKGQYLSANGQLAARPIGSEVGFVKSFFTAQAFRTLPRTREIVFASSARVGVASGFGSEPLKDLPASERFFAGGDTTVRAFALDQLGVRHVPAESDVDTIDSGGFPLGGNGLVIFNAEVRVPVRGGLGLVGFADAGNVFKRASDVAFGALRPAVGVGVRYRSPVGPIRFDLGFKVNRRAYERLQSWFITFGQAF